MYVYGSTQLEVKSENKLLLIGSGGGTDMVVLAYKEPLKFQVNLMQIESHNFTASGVCMDLL